jgi:hypothetical protein
MPASDLQQRRRTRRALAVLFWSGVGLTPVAVVLILVSDSPTALRLAAVLAVVAIVLIGMSITLRRETDTGGADVEDVILDEIEALHEDVREDISAAGRATEKAMDDRVLTLTETVEALREQVETLRDHVERGITAAPARAAVGAAPAASHGAPGVVRHTETVKVTTRSTFLDRNESGRGTVYGANDSRSGSDPQIPMPRRGDRAPVSAHDSGHTSGHTSAHGSAHPESTGESWTEQMMRQRLDAQNKPAARREVDDPDRITGVRATDRWAAVRSDDRGRELRMGERRAAMHADDTGTEVRIEDRWAAVLRQEDRRDEPLWHEEPSRGGSSRDSEWDRERAWKDSSGDRGREGTDGYWSESRWEAERADEPGRWTETHNSGAGRRGQAALPAAPAAPASSWTQGWDSHSEPLPELASRRSRGDGDGHRRTSSYDDAPRGRASRSRGDDGSDDRWR